MEISCTQCGGKVPIEEESSFLRCPFCETALYVETDRTVRHFYLPPTVKSDDLAAHLQRKLSYLEIKDPISVNSSRLIYFPVWRLDLAIGGALAVPATTPLIDDLQRLKISTGNFKLFDEQALGSATIMQPEVLLETAIAEGRAELRNETMEFSGSSLVHLPFFEVVYLSGASRQWAAVDAVSGEVYADAWPAGPQKEKDRVLGLIAGLATGAFFVEAVLIPGFWPTLGAYALTGVGIYLLARRTLAKMGW